MVRAKTITTKTCQMGAGSFIEKFIGKKSQNLHEILTTNMADLFFLSFSIAYLASLDLSACLYENQKVTEDLEFGDSFSQCIRLFREPQVI